MIARTVLGPTKVPHSILGRRLAVLIVAVVAFYALFGGTAFVGAASGPGSPDFLPNSGHQSNPMGAAYSINQDAKIFCSGDSVGSLSGTFDLSVQGTASQGAYLIVYLTPNNGSNANPIGNVEDNEAKIDLSGKTSGTYPWALTITSPFTATSGGILALFATPGAADDWAGGRANSLQCAESQPTPSPSPSPSPTGTGIAATPSPSPSPSPSPTGSEIAATPSPSPSPSPSGTEAAATPTLPASGSEKPATGTPSPSLPSTSTDDRSPRDGGGAPLMLLLVLLGAGAAGLVVLSPSSIRIRK